MSQIVVTPTKTFEASAALGEHLRVKLVSGLLAIAGLADGAIEIGTMDRIAFAAGDKVSVRLRSAQGTTKMVASEAISQGGIVYTVAGGKVSATATAATQVGVALEAAAADGDIIEVLRST